jgi:hypothetical protein
MQLYKDGSLQGTGVNCIPIFKRPAYLDGKNIPGDMVRYPLLSPAPINCMRTRHFYARTRHFYAHETPIGAKAAFYVPCKGQALGLVQLRNTQTMAQGNSPPCPRPLPPPLLSVSVCDCVCVCA